jgi:hypothetical protein
LVDQNSRPSGFPDQVGNFPDRQSKFPSRDQPATAIVARFWPSGDEYQTRAPIPIGPRTQMPRRMYEMLHPMHRDRRCRVGDIKDALHPQQCIAMAVKQHRQPDTEARPIDRLVEVERQSSDIIDVAMMTVGRMAMAICRLPALHAVAIG